MGGPWVEYVGKAGRAPSGKLWGDCPILELEKLTQGVDGRHLFDDFINTPILDPASNLGKYASYIDTGNTIRQLATERNGVLRILTDATDNDEAWITTGGNTGVLGVISNTAGDDKPLWFGARIRKAAVADNESGTFIGLAEEGLAAADTITDGGALADKDFIGFFQPETDGDGVDFVWRKAGQAVQTLIPDVAILVAATFVNLGFKFDPMAPPDRRIKVFVNNVEQSTYGTAAQIAAATFPNGEELAMLFGLKNGAGNARSIDCDWWRFGQVE